MPKRLDGNEIEENKDVDTRRFEAEDNEGHLKGSNQAHFDEQKARQAEDDDKSELNKKDDRDQIHDTSRRDL